MKKIFLLFFCVGLLGMAHAQQENTLGTMRSLPQATYTNPALVPIQKFYLGLPAISSIGVWGASNSLSYNNVKDMGLDGNAEEFSSETLLQIKSKMKDENWLGFGAQLDLFGLGFKAGPRLYFRYRLSTKVDQLSQVPADLLLLADEKFLNSPQQLLLSPQVNVVAYLENSLGASYLINPRLTVGANIKRLNGIATLHTKELELKLSSSSDRQQYNMEAEMLAYASGDDLLNTDVIDPLKIRDRVGGNGGWAVDLGATYQLNSKLQLGLSVLDLGAISWSGEATEYRLDRTAITFDALEANTEAEEQQRYEDFINTVSENFRPRESTVNEFRTALPTRMYLTATYELYRNIHATGTYFSEIYKGRYLPGFSAAVHKEFGRMLGLSLSYTAINNSYANIGTGLSLRLTPFQFYVVTDNALAALDWENAKNVNVRAGLNLVFGNTKKPSKLPY